jgi:hypothetical protein
MSILNCEKGVDDYQATDDEENILKNNTNIIGRR